MRRALFAAILAAPLLGTTARAEPQAGVFAAATGSVEVQRRGTGSWQPVGVGTPLYPSDAIRSGPSAAARVRLSDGSVVEMGEGARLTLERYTMEIEAAERRTLLRLESGTLGLLVETRYARPDWRFEVETPSAIALAEQTRFLVHYDAAAGNTEVVAVEGAVDVQAAIGLIGRGVRLEPGELTVVQRGSFPTEVRAVEDTELARYESALEIIGTGGPDGLAAAHVAVAGRIPAQDRLPRVPAVATADESLLRPRAPGETLMDRLSPDVRANTQPLPEYRAFPPDVIPPGS